MKNTIKIYAKNVYGNETFYVLDKEQATAIQTITKEKSLTPRAVDGFRALGFTFEEVLAPRA